MCDPATASILGMAASGIGTAVNTSNANKNNQRMVNARNEAMQNELNRQDAFQAESDQVFQDNLANYDKSNQDVALANIQLQRGNELVKSLAQPNEYAPTTGSAPDVVKSEVARKINDAMKSGRKTAKSLGNMGAFGDLQFRNRIGNQRSGDLLGEIGGNARRSSNLLPFEQSVAEANAFEPPSMFGDLIKLGGQGALSYGFGGFK